MSSSGWLSYWGLNRVKKMAMLTVVFLGGLLVAVMEVGAQVVWAPNPLVAIYEGLDYTDKDDPKCVVNMFGARNGEFCGQVVVFSKTPEKTVEAKMSDLKLSGGTGSIPASAAQVRYGLMTGVNGIVRLPAGRKGIYDALGDVPEAGKQAQPVWVTVKVPADAPAGTYEGTLAVAGRQVPVKLVVAAWTLPNPVDFTTYVDFIESPESVALRYDVPLWSDKHFELMGTCFAQLGRVGNKTMYLPLAGKSNLGNEHTIIRWVKTDKEREFKHDFTVMEKYLDLFLKHVGKPRIVICHVYENQYGGSQGTVKEDWARGVQVSLLDPATGKTENMEGPAHNNENDAYPKFPDDAISFWQPVIDGIRDRLKAKDIDEKTMAFGISSDMMPGKPNAAMLHKVAPYAGWAHHGHGARVGLYDVKGGYCTTVWNARFANLEKGRTYGWKNPQCILYNDRDIWKPDFQSQLVRSRILGELDISGQQRGFGRMSADFWPCLKDAKGNMTGSISSRFPKSNWNQLNLRQTPYLYPGPKGALATVRFEMMREGIQECEARIFIEKALLDTTMNGKLGEALATKCQELLDNRVRALLGSQAKKEAPKTGDGGLAASDAGFAESGWQEESGKLYATAAEVAVALAK